MYPILLSLHSVFRWLVLASLIFAIYRAYRGWLGGRPFLKSDDSIRHITATIAHIQFTLGIVLYFISPLIDYFLHNFKEAIHQRELRFFGMEHITMMILAIAILSIGSARAKRKEMDQEKFRTMAIWFTVALLIILSSIPWAFSPLTSRPWFRPL